MPDDHRSPANADAPREATETPPLPAHLVEVELPTENVVDIDLNLDSATDDAADPETQDDGAAEDAAAEDAAAEDALSHP